MYISYTFVDEETGRPINLEPALNGPVFPEISDLAYDFRNESAWPTSVPVHYGQCADDVDPNTPGILEVFTEEDYIAAKEFEMTARIERAERVAREERNKLLERSDWTQMPDSALSDEDRLAWQVYRQDLRDISNQEKFPNEINWPVAPGSQVIVQ